MAEFGFTNQMWDRFTTADEKRFAKVVNEWLDNQINPLLQRLEEGALPEMLIEERNLIRPEGLMRIFQNEYKRSGVKYLEHIYGQKKKSLNPDDPYFTLVSEWLETFAGQRIKSINETSRSVAIGQIKKIIAKAQDQGLSVPATRDLIEKELPDEWKKTGKFRAAAIARTEIANSANWASMQGAKRIARELGFELQKKWSARIDPGRTRDSHLVATGSVRDINEKFWVGGEYMDRPGDPNASAGNVVNCRCRLTYITSDEL